MIVNKVDLEAKIIFVGNSEVGKSNLILKLSNSTFYGETLGTTLSCDITTLKITTSQGEIVRLNLWDTAGQERFRTINQVFYKKSQGIVFVYSVIDSKSLEDLEKWISEAALCCLLKDNITAIVANKIDLNNQYCQDEKQLQKLQAFQKKMSQQYGSWFKIFYISAKTGQNLDYFKDWIVECVVNNARKDNPLGNRHIFLPVGTESIMSNWNEQKIQSKCC